MVTDLLRSGRLVGMSESDVFGVLGPPSARWDKELYYLGDDSYLMIHYDRSGRVVRVVGSELTPPERSRPFDIDGWSTAGAPERCAMARSLTTSHSRALAGVYRSAVHRRLGTPSRAWVTLLYDVGRSASAPAGAPTASAREYLFISLRRGTVSYATTARDE
jgi:hypothetical protein